MLSSWTGDTFYRDTNIVIFAVERENQWSTVLKDLFKAIDERAIHAFTSQLTIAEILVKPIAMGADDLIGTYNQVLAPDSIINVVPSDRGILISAAEFRAKTAVKLIDAIHMATARLCACEFFLTNDESLGTKVSPDMRWIRLSDLAENA
jgi:predicted nucleic acid-binding protein